MKTLLLSILTIVQIGGSGSIQGTVSDPTGAVIPRATVTATSAATGIETVRETTDAGVYVISPLAAGEYSVSVSSTGFGTVVQKQVIVDALSVVGLNFTLQLGAVGQELTVLEAAPILNTADARLGQTIRNEVYTALPLAMSGGPRDPTAFIYLLPGVQTGGRWGNVMGGQDFSTEVYVEGVPITNAVVQGEGRNLSLGISVEAIDQFQMETSGSAVMYNGQGASNYVVKSGSNAFHGAVYEYFRNTVLDARGFFAAKRPKENQNEFGLNFGGPIRRNRIFFFGSYDGYRDRRETRPAFISIPALAMRRGDFSALPVPIYDPATTMCSAGRCTRQAFPGNIIPPERISPISTYFQSFLPTPVNSGIQNNYIGSLPVGFNNDNTTIKVDAHASSKHQFMVLFAHGKRSQATPYRGGIIPLPYTETRIVEEIPTSAQLKHTYVLSPRLLTQVSFGFSRLFVPIQNATIEGKHPQKAGLKGLPPGEADSSFPEVSFAGPNSPGNWRGTDARAFDEALNNFTLQENVQWQRGKHAVTAGFQMQRLQANEKERTYGSLATFAMSNVQTAGFDANGTVLTSTGHSYASFLLGELNSATVVEDAVVGTGGRFRNYAWWVQDDFKLKPRLTFNVGLRYDIMQPYQEVKDRWSFMNATLPNPAADGRPGALQFVGFGQGGCNCRTPIKTYKGMIGPRFGFAYSISQKLVMRGAYGMMYSRRGAVGGRGGARNGTGLLGFSANATFPSPDGFTPALNWNNGIPAYPKPPFLESSLNAGFTTSRPSGGTLTYGDPDLGGHPPRYQNWNFGFQYALASTMSVGVNYAGSNGHFLGGGGRGIWSNQIDPKYLALGNLLRSTATPANIAAARAIASDVALPFPSFSGTIGQMLRPFPQFSGINDVYGDVGNSNYNSLQVTVEKRKSHGLLLQFNYTFSKELDDTAGGRSAYNWRTEKAVTTNDQTHIANTTFVYDLPAGRGHAFGGGNAILASIVGDWRLSGISQIRRGAPLGTIGASCNLPNAGNCYADYNPGFTGPVRINGNWGTGNLQGANPPSFIDRNAFVSPAVFTYGNSPRTLAYGLRNPMVFNQDLSLRRDFRVRENLRLSIQADAFNVLNSVRFGGIGANITNANFGRVSSQANTPRVVQFNARIEF